MKTIQDFMCKQHNAINENNFVDKIPTWQLFLPLSEMEDMLSCSRFYFHFKFVQHNIIEKTVAITITKKGLINLDLEPFSQKISM